MSEPPPPSTPPNPAEHLKDHRFQKGRSGNPGGRPKGRSLSAMIREKLREEHNGRAIGEIVVDQLLKEALRGKLPYIKELLDRAEGKVADRVEFKDKSDEPIVYIVPPPRLLTDEVREEYLRDIREKGSPNARIVDKDLWDEV